MFCFVYVLMDEVMVSLCNGFHSCDLMDVVLVDVPGYSESGSYCFVLYCLESLLLVVRCCVPSGCCIFKDWPDVTLVNFEDSG